MTYAKAIKELRDKLIVSQTELAQMLEVSFGSVSRWEKGHFEPTIKIKRKLVPLFEKYEIEVKREQ
jgi:DNA-binding XRE family transcriptional regulator